MDFTNDVKPLDEFDALTTVWVCVRVYSRQYRGIAVGCCFAYR